MAATIKGTPNAASGATVTIPTHAVGDLIIIFAYRDGSTTVPSKPTASGTVPAWTDIESSGGANTNSLRLAYFVATATNHTSGTWTNATGMIAVVIQGHKSSSFIGGHAQGGGTSSTLATAPSITQQQTSGKALILEFYGHRTVTAWSTAPSGYTRQASVATEVALNSKDSSTSDGSISQNLTAGSSSGYRAATLEILAPDTSPTVALSSPSDGGTISDTTPDLTFTGTDSESDDVRYEVQIYKQVASDNFNRANAANLGSNWSRGPEETINNNDPAILSNKAVDPDGSHDKDPFWNANAFANNQYAQVTITGIDTGVDCYNGVTVRANVSDYVIGQMSKAAARYDIVWYNGGTYTVIASSSGVTPTVNDVVRLEAIGTTFSLYVNGVLVASGSNASAPSSGAAGVMVSGTDANASSVDDWSAGDIIIDKISGTDAGFSGSPDNSDPFASGQAVTHTVQSALADGTYYWKVRGKDPSGTNTYGAWSAARSFILSSSSSAIKVINDVARANVKTINDLAIAALKAINGLA